MTHGDDAPQEPPKSSEADTATVATMETAACAAVNAVDVDGPDLLRPEISLRFVLPLIRLLRREHGESTVESIIRAAGLDPAALDDAEGWVSMKFLARLTTEIFSQLYGLEKPPPRGDPIWQLWRRAGREGFEFDLESLGSFLPAIRAFGSPGPLYRALPRGIRRANAGLDARILESGPGRVVISTSPCDPELYWEGHERCLWRMGTLESIPAVWNLPRAKVEHSRCMHDPDNPTGECVYTVTFVERPIWRILRSLFTVVIFSVLAATAKDLLMTRVAMDHSIILNGLLLGVAIEAWRWSLSMQRVQREDLENMRSLVRHHDQRYLDLWKESDELRRLALHNRNLSAYLPKALLGRLQGRRQPPSLGGMKREVTIVFADIQNYSTISEHIDPEQTIRILNRCFSSWVGDVQSHEGTVLEFLGDGMLAVFGAPNDLPDHACRALRCLRAMTDTMERLNESWSAAGMDKLWKRRGVPELGFRAGVHTGTVVAGNLGSMTQMKYAVVGDAVNVAARLEQLNKKLGSRIAVSGDTRALLPQDVKGQLVPRGRHLVKGRDQPVEVFSCGFTESTLKKNSKRCRRFSLH